MWLMRFYALLGEALDVHNEYVDINDLSIIRVLEKNQIKLVSPNMAFFPPDDESIDAMENVLFVKPSVYIESRSEQQKRLAKFFLEEVGVRQYDLTALVELKLARYKNTPKQVDSSYYQDLKVFISYWKNNTGKIQLFKNKSIFLAERSGNLFWFSAEQLCLDEPYLETGLAELASIHKRQPLWIGYQNKLGKNQLSDFVDFLKAIGAMTELTVVQVDIGKNPKWINQEFYKDIRNAKHTSSLIQNDYSIEYLEQYLESQSIECAKLIWHAMIKANTVSAKAKYRPNQTYSIREADSQLIYHLKNHTWIPNKQGKFCKPQDMSREDLPRDFPYDDRNNLLTAIGFGENARKRSEEYQAKNKKAQEMGFESAEQAAQFAELAKNGFSPEQWLAQQKSIELPEKSVPNPDRRRKGVLERSENAPNKEGIIRERSIQPGISDIQAGAKAYLRAIYTNKNGEMVCQCCQKEMPFKVGDDYYFEAVQCFRNTKHQYIENRLALCPVCSAMYQHARQTDDNQIKNLIITKDSDNDTASVSISISLASNNYNLRFVGSHWFDLKTIVENLK